MQLRHKRLHLHVDAVRLDRGLSCRRLGLVNAIALAAISPRLPAQLPLSYRTHDQLRDLSDEFQALGVGASF